jgi:hypothetical protein
VRSAIAAAAGAVLFVILATANSGGYRYGVSDQAFHVPAMAHYVDATLFPRDAALLEAQSSRTPAYHLFAAFTRTPADVPALFAVLYLAGMIGLVIAAWFYGRALGGSAWASAAAIGLLTFRHRIAKTGANSLEGYFNPRMLAFAIGIAALACVLRRRLWTALALAIAAGLLHPTTGLWLVVVVGVAILTAVNSKAIWAAAAVAVAAAFVWLAVAGARMDETWRSVLLEKDYLFSLQWPAYAWALNLLYLPLLAVIYRRRRALNVLAPGEPLLLAGLAALVAGFLLSLPLTAGNVALAVQLQINRIFWVLDAALVLYLGWWLMDDWAVRRGRAWRIPVMATIVLLSMVRGFYVVVIETKRPLVQARLPPGDWTDALNWIRQQPVSWHVLADPNHAAKFGFSVRVGALRDTVLEQSKDAGLGIYERDIALRVAERREALSAFESFGDDQIRAAARRFGADVALVDRAQPLSFPVLYQNQRFVVYDLR